MGATTSKLEDDKALLLCRERKRFVRQAVDGRCSLAEAHVAYIQSLRRIGTALRKFVEPDAAPESSLFTSTSATPEPLALTEKSTSQFSFSSPSMSQRVDPMQSLTPSPPYSGHTHTNYMKKGVTPSTKVEEKPPVSVTATLKSSFGNSKNSKYHLDGEAPFVAPPSPQSGMPSWDYFDIFNHPLDHQFSFQDGRDNMEDISRLREEEDIPDLEEDGEKSTITHNEEEYSDSEGDFEKPSSVPLVQSYQRRADIPDMYSPSESPTTPLPSNINLKIRQLNGGKDSVEDDMDEADEKETPNLMHSKGALPVSLLSNGDKTGLGKVPSAENKLAPKDFLSSIKEIENLFVEASDSGKEVLRMLEANEVQYRPMLSETTVGKSGVSMFISACLVCFEAPEKATQGVEPPSSDIKYLTWHRSSSLRSSSSRNPLGAASKDEIFDGGNIHKSFCMNSGSHASTLDRLYAWERKLYDEVKVSGIIRREYELKCKMLRQQESRGESSSKIDKTRAAVKDLHSRIKVAIHRIDSISKKIEELRDKELQPQLEELIQGLSQMWELMLRNHKLQFNIISVAYNSGNSNFSLQSEYHQQATMLLEYELNSLLSSFTKWISTQKSYVRGINNWLLKCVFPLQKRSTRRRQEEFSPTKYLPPPIFITCRDWLKRLDELPTKEVQDGIRGLQTVTTRYLPKQEKAQDKKLSSTLSWKSERAGEIGSNMMRKEVQLDWNSGFESLQKSLISFFEQFNNLADASVKNSIELDMSIKKAKEAYEHGGKKMQL